MKSLLPLIALSCFVCTAIAQPPQQRGGQQARSPTMEQMQERMQEMHERMQRIHQTEDPAERQRLMQEHREAMRQNMGMMGRMMREEPAQQRPRARACPPGDTECRLERMETRQETMREQMQMMHQMMEQMMEAQTSEDED
jgi:hypothetical protein